MRAFQHYVKKWVTACFGVDALMDRRIRNHRFLEEALQLVQACGSSADEAHRIVDYVYGRPQGKPVQEVGGVMTTLCALCEANAIDLADAAEAGLSDAWNRIDQIRVKNRLKPKFWDLNRDDL